MQIYSKGRLLNLKGKTYFSQVWPLLLLENKILRDELSVEPLACSELDSGFASRVSCCGSVAGHSVVSFSVQGWSSGSSSWQWISLSNCRFLWINNLDDMKYWDFDWKKNWIDFLFLSNKYILHFHDLCLFLIFRSMTYKVKQFDIIFGWQRQTYL